MIKIPLKLPQKEFLATFELVPRTGVSLLVVKNGVVLLTRRGKPPFAGFWHLPGSFLLKDEKLFDCLRRVAKDELGVVVSDIKLAGAFDDISGDPRGHVVDLIYKCKIRGVVRPVGDTKEIRFFKKLPAKIGFNHKETLSALGYR